MKTAIGTIIALILTGVAGSAIAWEVDSFHSGMAQEEALADLARWGKVTRVQDEPGGSETYLVSPPDVGPALGFCDGRLVSYQINVAGGWHAFMRRLDRERRSRGSGAYAMIVQDTHVGPWSSLTFEWPDGPDVLSVGHSLIGDGAPQTFWRYDTPNACGH